MFTPGPTNLQNYTPDQIRQYFKENEKGAILNLPQEKGQFQRSVEHLLGIGEYKGNRYQAWPERAVRDMIDAASLPRDVVEGKVDLNDKEATQRLLNLAPLAVLGIAPIRTALTGMGTLETKALENYIGAGYTLMNQHLRGEGMKMPGYITRGNLLDKAGFYMDKALTKPSIKFLDTAFKSVPETTDPMVVFRNISHYTGGYDKLKVGDTINFPAFTSTSKEMHVANKFGNVQFRIHVPAGSKVLDITKQTRMGWEAEVLFPRNAQFKVVGEPEVSGRERTIYLEYQPPKKSK